MYSQVCINAALHNFNCPIVAFLSDGSHYSQIGDLGWRWIGSNSSQVAGRRAKTREYASVFHFEELNYNGVYSQGPKRNSIRPCNELLVAWPCKPCLFSLFFHYFQGSLGERQQDLHHLYLVWTLECWPSLLKIAFARRHGLFRPISLNKYLLKARLTRLHQRIDSMKVMLSDLQALWR